MFHRSLISRSPAARRPRARGFTLVEMLIGTTIMGMMVTAVLGFFINMMKSYKYNSFRLSINRDVRTFTNELTDTATYANYYVILTDFSTRTTGAVGSEVLASMGDGESGDCVLLVFKDPANDTKISRLIGYYHDPDANGFGPVRKFDITFNPSTTSTSLWTLMPDVSTLHTNPDIISAGTVGKATGTSSSGRLFYNFFNRSVMVKGQINYISNDGLTRRAVSTYNFTVSPRG
ncbi:MAG TPA: prepilin-type N-terminal cleavage/methylation domain-containing protein [Opitutaceae bacterium]|nr:prepilin-type N-terminal cleavage/methylation domain-containing protein [Opitutaceae bacterium]